MIYRYDVNVSQLHVTMHQILGPVLRFHTQTTLTAPTPKRLPRARNSSKRALQCYCDAIGGESGSRGTVQENEPVGDTGRR
jgi:hypothetical protein